MSCVGRPCKLGWLKRRVDPIRESRSLRSRADGGEVRNSSALILAIIVIVVVLVITYCLMTVNISALPDPGPLETRMAMRAKDWYISRAARRSSFRAPASDAASVSAGQTLFGMGCAPCHGKDGRSPSNIGKSMYPRALDLSSREVQEMSDRQLFWVIKNGIRLSGMPGFANILSDDQIWQLKDYVRSLDKLPKHRRQD